MSLWTNAKNFLQSQCSSLEYDWLTNEQSLTQRLRQLTQGLIKFSILKNQWQQPNEEEMAIFPAKYQKSSFWIREIIWQFNQEVWILGRVVIPISTLLIHDKQLQKESHRAIGEILFSKGAKRLFLELQNLNYLHPYHPNNQQTQWNIQTKQTMWCRRSLFSFYEQPLLVVETFLPDFFSAVKVLQIKKKG